ncbi:hypothetical protein A3H80_02060 [Candidatus Roizmanbacteria bacterium RIFCSPLOWO2_02_FULL_37_19]|uniref:Mechanosensitive ion channel protein MscL n=1 Tax=Candidatus Roizmanbacteria bacterium RIFCSPHIGHO2_02_FULL_37_24 TaxID=1802037 RepID=A0A1F7GZM0_9BACT|nr:MAG: hypothetical protein A2862_02645 [Candidatus Roizmanbacteria bacterium RIFCSPHIGHO2_01_FULL_38_41]OGK24519.1 MAG: hypothetical protein A3C24_03140 [Candidatus Roizmanbacteria bacterium RIFCSPHIGHO2_02_FULL_37_24]OGK31973.1 MAG: hypothetical protein A3E10_04480 [Candidatus Roizmanbacteria bacterium RIFCSPHIGHO2_12_FULL_37_23]OGK43774.1 MAG: hypothetical protein A2956_04605 [Candidatus Roizmanbacteria bacterium RIFCSPLOWO2_01_FULL_37_57]OGK54328.1 MAG: hypothetical protein A3H80_02060 [Ca
MKGFLEFIREQKVAALAVGFILGGAITKLITSLVNDIINPIIGLALGFTENLSEASIHIGSAEIRWGNFINVLIDFVIIALVVYFVVKALRIEKTEKKKSIK